MLTKPERIVLRAFALWTIWVWGTRIWNVVDDETRSAGFKAVHIALAAVSVALAVACWVVVSRATRRARATRID